MNDDSRHKGVVIIGPDGIEMDYVDKPHDASDCEAACEEALHGFLGNETVYEATDAKETRKTSIGWSRSYGSGYNNIDWSN